jgi:hypothetical protein
MSPILGPARDGGGYAMKRTLEVPFLAPVRTSAKRAYKFGFFALGAVMLFGCPIYSGSSGGSNVVCNPDGVCCDPSAGGCPVYSCQTNDQCPADSVCENGVCASGYYDGGSDDASDDSGYDATTDCSVTGCEPGYECTLTNGTAVCLPEADAGSDTSTPETGIPDGGVDATDAQVIPPFTGCTSDNACVADSGAGSRCIDGTCVAAANECTDSTQCPTVGTTQEECVQGVCTPSCAGGAACPTGYACDSGDGGTGVCSVNPTPCGSGDGGAACASGTTCVDQHCVPTCTPGSGADAAPTCSGTGLVCVDNGCIPDQAPQFICNTEGVQDNCASGSICLHHSCYIACTPGDSGANTCQHADNFNLCKPVTTSTGTYNVCGSSSNLGNECDPTQGKICTSPSEPVCIDGYCR